MRVYYLQKILQILAASLVIYLILSIDRLCEVNQTDSSLVGDCHKMLTKTLFTYDKPAKSATEQVLNNSTGAEIEIEDAANMTESSTEKKDEKVNVRTKRNEKSKILPTDDELLTTSLKRHVKIPTAEEDKKEHETIKPKVVAVTAKSTEPEVTVKVNRVEATKPEKATTVTPVVVEAKKTTTPEAQPEVSTQKTVEKKEETEKNTPKIVKQTTVSLKTKEVEPNSTEAVQKEPVTVKSVQHNVESQNVTEFLNTSESEGQKSSQNISETTTSQNVLAAGRSSDVGTKSTLTSKIVHCMKLTQGDIFGFGNEYLTERVKDLRTPAIFMMISILAFVVNMAHVYTSFLNPKQCNTIITNLVHVVLWGISGICLMLFRHGWNYSWKTSGNFYPEYPNSYLWAEIICHAMLFVIVIETYFYKVFHYNIYVEKASGVYKILEPSYKCSIYNQITLDGSTENNSV